LLCVSRGLTAGRFCLKRLFGKY